MSGRIAEETIQRIRERIDIVELVSSYLPLKRSGVNYLGLCPFHGEKSPSFNVNSVRQIFHCFGCGVGGNAVTFVMRMEGLTFPEALRRLGEKVGVAVEEESTTPEQLRQREHQAELVRLCDAAADYYHHQLMQDPAGEPGRLYLRERDYGQNVARNFRLGYAPDRREGLAAHLEERGFPARSAVEVGLVRPAGEGRSRFDLLRGRLIFPIQDERGRVVAFGGRILGAGQPKYLNSPESVLYHKGRTLYGLFQAREEMRRRGEVLVVEGYFDLLALHRAGFTYSVATCGTALTSEQARLLKRYAGRVLLLFDSDSAGVKATFRAMDVLLAEGLSPAAVTLDAGEDPDSFLRKAGSEALRTRLAAARPALELFIEATLERHGDSIEGRARALEEITTKLRLVPSEIERSLYLNALARRYGLDERLLRKAAPATVSAPSPTPGRATPVPPPAPRPAARAGTAVTRAQTLLLQLLLAHGKLRRQAAEFGVESLFPAPEFREIARALLELAAGDEHIDGSQLIDGLDPPQQAILSGILVGDEGMVTEAPERIFADCREIVRREGLKQRKQQLQQILGDPAILADAARLGAVQREFQDVAEALKKH